MKTKNSTDFLSPVAEYYADKLALHGSTSRGVDWNSPESQSVRFEQLSKVINCADDLYEFTILVRKT